MYTYEEQKKTLKIIHSILLKNDFLSKMPIFFGTLLGAVRQGKLNTSINNWDDLDFCVNKENFDEFLQKIYPELKQVGFEVKYVWYTSFGQIGELTLYRGEERLDINQLFPVEMKSEKYYLHCHWYGGTQLTKGLNSKYHTKLAKIKLEGLEFYGPENYQNCLIDLYGENWKIPCKSEDEYKYWEDSPGIPWWNRTQFLKVENKL